MSDMEKVAETQEPAVNEQISTQEEQSVTPDDVGDVESVLND